MNGPASVELENVSMGYQTPGGVIPALHDVSFSLEAGQSMCSVCWVPSTCPQPVG
jgi:hypothetical protein